MSERVLLCVPGLLLALAVSASGQLCGDCDGNGAVTITDSLLAAQVASSLHAPSPGEFNRCNVLGALEPDPAATVDVLDSLVLAQWAAGLPAALSCTPPLIISTILVCDGVAGSAYAATIVAGGGSGVSYSWAIVAGALPAGITLSPTGTPSATLAGTPVASGSFSFTVEVVDGAGWSDTRAFAMEVEAAGALRIETCELPPGSLGVAYDEAVTGGGGTETAYSWSVFGGALPPGLTLDPRGDCPAWGAFTSSADVDLGLAPAMTEISGVAASRLNPGVLWVHDDSGATAALYAIDASGNLLQEYRLSTTAIDWEDIALGPGPAPASEYLHIGDVGDNGAVRSDVHVLRVEEPVVPPSPQSPIVLIHEEFYFMYPGGARDCETVLVDWETGVVHLIEKASGGTDVFRFPGALDPAWTMSSPAMLVQVAPTTTLPGLLTGGDSSRDGRRIVVRGYGTTMWELARPAGAPFEAVFNALPCTISFTPFQQYEALCYTADGTELISIPELSFWPTVPIHRATAVTGPLDTHISGVPTMPGTHAFELELVDSSGDRVRRQFSIEVQ